MQENNEYFIIGLLLHEKEEYADAKRKILASSLDDAETDADSFRQY